MSQRVLFSWEALQRLARTAVFWSWVNNALRAVSGLLVTALLFRELTPSEWGMSGVLVTMSALGVVFDFGFAPTVDRFIAYAMGGAKSLEAQGVPQPSSDHTPNYELIWDLLATTRRLYRYLTLILFVIMGSAGTVIIENLIQSERRLHADFSLLTSRLAWALTLLSMLLDIYSNWWGVFLRGLNQVRSAAKIATGATTVKCVVTTILLLHGGGLLSLPIGGLASSFIQRRLARWQCLRLLPPSLRGKPNIRRNLNAMWPNSWRMGLQLLSTYMLIQVNTLFCAHVFHFAGSGAYTYSLTLMNYASTMAIVWTSTKWPIISQYQTRRDYAMIRKVLRPRIWLQAITFLTLGAGVAFIAPSLLHWIGKDKNLLPLPWMLLLVFSMFMDLQLSMFGTLISTGNRLPFLWPGILTNVLSMFLSLILLRFTTLGLGAFVAGPVLGNLVFNYWYWPFYAAHGLRTTFWRLLFGPDGTNDTVGSEEISINY